MADAEKPVQARQAGAIARCGITTSKLLAQEIDADFCHHPFTQRTVAPILPPGGARGRVRLLTLLGCLLSAVHRITHRQADGRALFFQQSPSQQESGDRWQGGLRCFTAQALVLQKLFDPLEDELDVPTRLIQAQHLLVTPLLTGQCGQKPHPAC